MTHNEKLDAVYNIIDIPLRKLRPNYGYVEVYGLAEGILQNNDYLLPDTSEEILELLKLLL